MDDLTAEDAVRPLHRSDAVGMLDLHLLVRACGLAAAAAVMAAATGCTSPADPGTRSAVPGRSAAATTGTQVIQGCPVTRAVPAAQLPPVLAHVGGDMDGAHDLWVGTSTSGWQMDAWRDHGRYGVKWGTFTLRHGRMTSQGGPPVVRARRLDGPGTAAASLAMDDYATATTSDGTPSGFWPTVIDFPHPGCWQVTETYSGETVRFTMLVAA